MEKLNRQMIADCVTMAMSAVLKESMTREELLKLHPYAIWQNGRGLWTTWIPDVTKPNGRRQISRKKLEALENEIIKTVEAGRKVTIREMFEDFIDRKMQQGIRKATRTRYTQTFNRHFNEKNGWDRKDIRRVTSTMFSEFLEDEIARCELTSKSFSSLKLILKGIIKTARRKSLVNYTMYDVLFDVDEKTKKNPKRDEDEVLTEEELKEFLEYLLTHKDTKNLCILLMLLSGTRGGEMVGLEYTDFSGTKGRIQRAETRYEEDGCYHYEIIEPKTEAGKRDIFLPSDYAWILDELRRMNPEAKYLAVRDDGKTRLHTHNLRWRMYRICEKIEAFEKRKSPHKLRKTFCSILLDAGFDQNLIIKIMGHVSIETSERYYHRNRKTDERKQEMIDNIVEFKLDKIG